MISLVYMVFSIIIYIISFLPFCSRYSCYTCYMFFCFPLMLSHIFHFVLHDLCFPFYLYLYNIHILMFSILINIRKIRSTKSNCAMSSPLITCNSMIIAERKKKLSCHIDKLNPGVTNIINYKTDNTTKFFLSNSIVIRYLRSKRHKIYPVLFFSTDICFETL